jgi:hypothetical protein
MRRFSSGRELRPGGRQERRQSRNDNGHYHQRMGDPVSHGTSTGWSPAGVTIDELAASHLAILLTPELLECDHAILMPPENRPS